MSGKVTTGTLIPSDCSVNFFEKFVVRARKLLRIPFSQLPGGAAVSSHCYHLELTAAPPTSWDKGRPDKHHIDNVQECIVS